MDDEVPAEQADSSDHNDVSKCSINLAQDFERVVDEEYNITIQHNLHSNLNHHSHVQKHHHHLNTFKHNLNKHNHKQHQPLAPLSFLRQLNILLVVLVHNNNICLNCRQQINSQGYFPLVTRCGSFLLCRLPRLRSASQARCLTCSSTDKSHLVENEE